MEYKHIYDLIIHNAMTRDLDGYIEKHHITPKCMGGCNDESNLVRLTAREHFIVHRLLAKIHPTNHGLVYAAFKMSMSSVYSSKDYSTLRAEHAKLVSRRFKGIPQTDEHKAKKSKALTGQSRTLETRSRMSMSALNISNQSKQNKSLGAIRRHQEHPHTDETKRKISESKQGIPLSEDHKKAMSNAMIKHHQEHPVSKETRTKIGNLHRGKTVSEDTRKKLAEISTGNTYSAKHWVLISPDGVTHNVYNLKAFCDPLGINWKVLSNSSFGIPMVKGKAKGWLVVSCTR